MGGGLRLLRGQIVWLVLDPTVGHEQQGVRPAVIVSDDSVSANQCFPLIAVVPLTGTIGKGALYPILEPGDSGLTKRSCALVDHLRSVDKQRVVRFVGAVSDRELRSIDIALRLYLGLK